MEPNEATLTSLARLAAAVRDPAMAFSVVRRMAAAGIPPRLRSYGPALFAYCDARDANGAAEVEAHMDAGGVVPEETELTALLRVNADIGRADQVYRVLHRTRTLVRQVCQATAQVVEAWFRSDAAAEAGVDKWDARKVREGVVKGGGGWHGQGWLGKGQWDVGQSEMDKDGRCQRCGEKLVCIDIDPSETETFAKSLAELACNREVRDDFVRFQDWLHRHGPFDAVIDAANVGLYKSKAFSFSQVNSVVNGIQRVTKSKKLPLIVLHRSRVNCGPAKTPQNQKLIESWRNAGALYSTPPGSNDDWYWLYAAVSCRSLLVTNDEMRDHLFQLLGTSFFPRWKEKHQVRLTYSGRGPTFHLPPPYSIVIQESEAGSWHVPTTTGDDIESPRQWVCATRKTSERPPSPPPQARATSKTLEGPPSPPPQARATGKTSEGPPSPLPQARATRKTSEGPPSPPPQARTTSKTLERPASSPPQAHAGSKTLDRPPSPLPQARAARKTSGRLPSPPPQASATNKNAERPSPSPKARLSDLGW